MSERLAEIGRRIVAIGQLSAVVNAMRGIAAARARQGRALLPAIHAYAETTARAIREAQRLADIPFSPVPGKAGRRGLIVFGAEQGFAGAFVEQALDAAAPELVGADLFLLGTRAATLAGERGYELAWTAPMPSRAEALPATAILIAAAIEDYLDRTGAVPIGMIYPISTAERGTTMTRRGLLPLDLAATLPQAPAEPPLINLSVGQLLAQFGEEHVFAQLCEAAGEAFTAENEARLQAMAAAKANVESRLAALQAEERQTRQEEITAEIVELAAGARSRARSARTHPDAAASTPAAPQQEEKITCP